MAYLFLKALLTGVIAVAISEIAKRSSLLAAVLASLPLTSILAFVWMFIDSKDIKPIQDLSYGIFWMVIPSLAFFLILPVYLKHGFRFYPSLLLACASTAFLYSIYAFAMGKFGVKF